MRYVMKPNERQYNLLLLLLSLVAFVMTFHFFGQPVQPGLDSSWKYAHNRFFFADDIRIGRDVIGTYGPFGFLVNAMPIGSNLRIAYWFEVLIRISLVVIFVFLLIGDRTRSPAVRIVSGLMLLLLLSTVNRGEKTPGIELVALAAGLVLTAYKKDGPAFLAGAIVLTSLALLIKFSIGILCLSFLSIYGLWVLVQQREVLRPVICTFGPIILVAAIWLALYRDFQSLCDYLIGSLEQSRGYFSAMTSLHEHGAQGWIIAGIAVLLFLLYTIRRERDMLFVFLLFTPGLLLSIKYGVTKQPQFLFHYAFLMLFLVAGQARTLARQVSNAALMSFLIFFLNIGSGFLEVDAFRFDREEPVVKPLDLRTSLEQLTNFQGYEDGLRSESVALLNPARLDAQTLAIIGNGSVDAYPWEISFIPANNLNWRPRPVFQSYFTYTPWLDSRNEAFFRSDRAPMFLLWDTIYGANLESIDGRYLLNDEPLTIIQILSNYSVLDILWNAVVFKRVSKPALRPPVIMSTSGPIDWNSRFDVPYVEGGIVRARLQYTRTLLGRLLRTLYRDSPVFVDYLFESGDTVHCRLVLDNAVSGIWVNPFVDSVMRPYSAKRVVAMQIMNPDAERGAFAPQFSVQWEFIGFEGQPAPFLLTRKAS